MRKRRYTIYGYGLGLLLLLTLAATYVVFLREAKSKRWMPDSSLTIKLAAKAHLATTNVMPFEGGNLARIVKKSARFYELYLRDDNDDALPQYWRQWWFAKIDNLSTEQKITFLIKGQAIGGLYVPAFSYDNKRWQLFTESDVQLNKAGQLYFAKKFTHSTVYLARYVPYTYTDLLSWLERLKWRRSVLVKDIGSSPSGRLIPQITITNKSSTPARKYRVMVHARTHPGEVASSFLLEGLVDFASGNSGAAYAFRQKLILDIVPMLNVDGVISGNNRVNPAGINLEGKWYRQLQRQDLLDPARAPREVQLLHAHFLAASKESAPISMALNLHSSAGEPEDQIFFFPHFGPQELGYQVTEANLYSKQMRLISLWQKIQGEAWFNSPAKDGQRHFLAKSLPETWWWNNFQDRVMALSIESVYGKAGRSGRWVTPDDMRRLGRSLGEALALYHGVTL